MQNEEDKFKEIIIKNKVDVSLLIGAMLLGIFLDWGNIEIIIFTIFIGSILRPIASKYFAIPALFFLSITPFLLILKREERAEEFAVYAYYFLVMAVLMGIYEIRRDEANKRAKKLASKAR